MHLTTLLLAIQITLIQTKSHCQFFFYFEVWLY